MPRGELFSKKIMDYRSGGCGPELCYEGQSLDLHSRWAWRYKDYKKRMFDEGRAHVDTKLIV